MFRKVGLTIFLLFLSLAGLLWGVEPIEGGAGARPAALGNSFVGLSNDGSAFYFNPAGLAQIKKSSFLSTYSRPEEDSNFASLSFSQPGLLFGGVVGSGYRNLTLGNIQASSEIVSATVQDLYLSYAKYLKPDLTIGGSLRLLSRQMSKDVPGFAGFNASGSALDLGIQYSPRPWLTFGAVQKNIGGKLRKGDGTEEELTAKSAVGTSLRLGGEGGLYRQIKSDLLVNGDLSKDSSNSSLQLHLGVEWWLVEILALRCGLDQILRSTNENVSNIAAGFGLKYKGITFDYAYYKNDFTLDKTHYFSLGYIGYEPPKVGSLEVLQMRQRLHFSDIPANYWAKEPIEKLATIGLIDYYQDGTFRPERQISRAEAVRLLVIAKEYQLPKEKKVVFSDVPTTFWAADVIQAAQENKLTLGYPDGTFKPRQATSRLEGITFLSRFDGLTLKRVLDNPFNDLSQKSWGIKEVLAADEKGWLDYLSGNRLQPNQSLTRAELAEMLYRTGFARERLGKVMVEE